MAEPVINVVGLSNPKSNSKTNWKVISAIVGIIVLALGVIAGIILVRQNQDVREQAACVAQCPGDDNVLMSCHDPAESSGGDTLDSICNSAIIGRIEVCGQTASTAKEYCCTTNGWKTNLTLCSSAQSTATATATSTSTATATATSTSTSTSMSTSTATSTAKSTATATSKATSTAKSTPAATLAGTATPFPVPETGAEWPTIIGAGLGIVMLVISLGLAL